MAFSGVKPKCRSLFQSGIRVSTRCSQSIILSLYSIHNIFHSIVYFSAKSGVF